MPCMRWDEATVRVSSAACADELGMSSRSKRGAQGSPGFRRLACERQYRSSSDKAHQPLLPKRGSWHFRPLQCDRTMPPRVLVPQLARFVALLDDSPVPLPEFACPVLPHVHVDVPCLFVETTTGFWIPVPRVLNAFKIQLVNG